MSITSVSGTQSPPLEATGEDKPMGASSVESAQKGAEVEAVPDYQQRKRKCFYKLNCFGTVVFACRFYNHRFGEILHSHSESCFFSFYFVPALSTCFLALPYFSGKGANKSDSDGSAV